MGFRKNPKIEIVESGKNSIANISIIPKNMSISEFADRLDSDFGILSRAGLHCSPNSHRFFGTIKGGGSVRISPGFFNTEDEMRYIVDSVLEISKII